MNTSVFCVCGHTVKNVRQMPAHEKGLGHRTRIEVIQRHASGFAPIQTRYRDWFTAAGLPHEEGAGKFHPGGEKIRGRSQQVHHRNGVERVLWVPKPLALIVTCGRSEVERRVFLHRLGRFSPADRAEFLRGLDAAIRLSSPEDALSLIFAHVPGDAEPEEVSP